MQGTSFTTRAPLPPPLPFPCSLEDNAYSHPLDMTPIVDLSSKRVIRIDLPLKGPSIKWNKEDNNYHTQLQGPTRTDMKPLNITQPEVRVCCTWWERWY